MLIWTKNGISLLLNICILLPSSKVENIVSFLLTISSFEDGLFFLMFFLVDFKNIYSRPHTWISSRMMKPWIWICLGTSKWFCCLRQVWKLLLWVIKCQFYVFGWLGKINFLWYLRKKNEIRLANIDIPLIIYNMQAIYFLRVYLDSYNYDFIF